MRTASLRAISGLLRSTTVLSSDGSGKRATWCVSCNTGYMRFFVHCEWNFDDDDAFVQFFVPHTINDGFFKRASPNIYANYNGAGSHFTGQVFAATKLRKRPSPLTPNVTRAG